jgi:transcriptional regulator with XRE-family HTH domain
MAKIAGTNAQTLRRAADVSLENLALAMQSYGRSWSTGQVGDFEAGRTAPNLATLLAVAAALGDVIGHPVTVAELFAGKGLVAINDRLTAPLSALRGALSGEPVHLRRATRQATLAGTGTLSAQAVPFPKWAQDAGVDPALYVRVLNALRESDTRMCKNIGVEPDIGAAAMAKLWRKTFSAERDLRAEPGANPQRRGQISRQLKAELVKVIGA